MNEHHSDRNEEGQRATNTTTNARPRLAFGSRYTGHIDQLMEENQEAIEELIATDPVLRAKLLEIEAEESQSAEVATSPGAITPK